MDVVPGAVPSSLIAQSAVPLLRPDRQVFEAMLHGWRNQMLARGLATATIRARGRQVERFHEYTNEYPWAWSAADVDDYFADRRIWDARAGAFDSAS